MKIELAIRRFALRALGLTGAAAALLMGLTAPAHAAPRTQVVPYLEAQQVLSADLNDGDVLTYTSLAVGVDAKTTLRRVEAQVSYRYEHRIAWEDGAGDDDVHSGLAAVRAEIVPDTVTFNAGALAVRARTDGVGPVFGAGNLGGGAAADVYSVYAGPDFSSRLGTLDVAASYRIGYVNVDDHRLAGFPDRYDSSINQTAKVSVGMGPRDFPFGWTIGAGYAREDVDRLDQVYEAQFVRGDIILPVAPTLAFTAGIGYEKIEASQDDILRDANGVPIVSPGGRLVADPSKPRLLAYDQSGVIWDAGVIWRPSRRTELQARVGRRYGDTTYIGSIEHKFNSAFAISGSVYDSVDSFGRVIVADVASVPVNFRSNRNPLNPGFSGAGGCVFGNDPGTGACFDDAFQAISTANFRHRGANLLLSGGRGPWSMGLGANYSQRKYFQPVVENGFGLERLKDESFTLSGSLSRQLSRTSGAGVEAFAGWYDSDAAGFGSTFSTGITGNYHRSFLFDRMQAQAALGLYRTEAGPLDSTVAQALIGLRYSF